jgi:hypothetical protein
MGLFKSWLKLVAYPVLRPAKDIKQSAQQVAADVAAARQQHREKVEEAAAIRGLLQDKTPQQKFEEMYAALGWTDAALERQRIAAARTRIGMVATGLLGFFALLALMWLVPRWLIVVLGPMAVFILAGCVALGIRYAWWEINIEERSSTPFASFLARDDLFSRLFAGTRK